MLLVRARRALSVLCTAGVVASVLVSTAVPATAAPALTIRPITWDVIGLDSNSPATGPDTFPVGARICNTGSATALGLASALVFDSTNASINADGPVALTLGDLAPGACRDAYFNVVVTKTAAAFNTARQYRITASATGATPVATPSGRQLFVEKLVSQNRNAVTGLSGSALLTAPSATGPGTARVVVGETYTFRVDSKTATGGYEQLESFLTFPTALFQVLSTRAVYAQPTGAVNDTLYADACGWDPIARACVGPVQYTGGKAGGSPIATDYTVKVVRAGTGRLSTLIYDFSGSSFHYNSDFGANTTSVSVTAVEAPDLRLTKTHVGDLQRGSTGTYDLEVANVGLGSTSGPVTVVDTLPAGLSFVSGTGTGWTCSASGQTVTCTDVGPVLPGDSRLLRLSVLAGGTTATQVVNTARVSTPDDVVTANDTATDPTYVNSSPVAVDDTRSTPSGTPVTLDPRANDTDPDTSTTLSITASGPASTGAVTCSATSCTYTPSAGFVGTATFPYTVSDGRGGSASAVVSVAVANAAPVFTGSADNATQSVVFGGTPRPLAATDVNADPLSYAVVSGSLPAGITLRPDGSFAGTATTLGTSTVVVEASDGRGGTARTTLTITVTDPATATVGDTVFVDGDGDGVQGTSEPGAAGQLVTVTAADGTARTATTDSDGRYAVTGLLGGSYTVSVSPSAPFAAAGTTSRTVQVGPGGTVADADFAVQRSDASLSGSVFDDLDRDGVREDGEDGLGGVFVTVTGNGQSVLVQTRTDGGWSLSGLVAGTYAITSTAPDGRLRTTPQPLTVALPAGETRSGLDLGLVEPTRPVAVDDSYSLRQGGTLAFDPTTNDTDPQGGALSLTSSTQPAAGAGTVTCTGSSCSYAAAPGFTGDAVFTYTVRNDVGTATATVRVTVSGGAPVVTSAPTQSIPTGGTPADLTAQDPDAGDTVTFSLASGALPPGLTLLGDGSFDGTALEPGTFPVVVRVTDSTGRSTTSGLTLTVVNTAPAFDDVDGTTSRTVDLGSGLAPLAATDPDAPDRIAYVLVSGDLPPGLTLLDDGSFVGTTTALGTYTSVVEVSDGRGGTDRTTLVVEVVDPRTARIGDTVYDDLDANGRQDDGEPGVAGATVTLTGGPQPVRVVTGADGRYAFAGLPAGQYAVAVTAPAGYVPAATASASITLSVAEQVDDADLGVRRSDASLAGTVFRDRDGDAEIGTAEPGLGGVTVTATLSTPDGPLTRSTTTDDAGRWSLSGLLAGTWSVALTAGVPAGWTATTGLPRDVVVPAATAVDGVDLGLQPPPPTAVDDAYSTPKGAALVVDPTTNDADPEGEQLMVSVVTEPTRGTVICQVRTCTYAPADGFAGADSLRYRITTTDGRTAEAGVVITVVNTAPAFTTAPTNTRQDLSTGQTPVPLLAEDPDGDPLRFSVVSGLPEGLELEEGGRFTGSPLEPGTYTVVVRVLDSSDAEDLADLVLVVSAAPVAQDDVLVVGKDRSGTVDVLANDAPGTGAQTVAVGDLPAAGTVECAVEGCTYTPNDGFTGEDSFTYVLTDANQASDTATVTVLVTASPAVPVAVDDVATTPANTPVRIDVLGNDTAGTGTQSIAVGTRPADGTVSCTIDGGCAYTPGDGFTGTDAFTYTVTDANQAADTATVTITVTAVDQPTPAPATQPDSAEVVSGRPVDIDVLANDVLGTSPVTIAVGTGPSDGSVACALDGCTYTPADGFTGQDGFTYVLTDADGRTSTGTVTVDVVAAPAVPAAQDDVASTRSDRPVALDVLANDLLGTGPTSLAVVDGPASGSVTCADGVCTYTPHPDAVGDDAFTYELTDAGGATSRATVRITVLAVPADPTLPAAVDDAGSTVQDRPVTVDVTANDGLGTEPTTIAVVSGPAHGSVECTLVGCVYAPDAGFTGTDSFDYALTDADQATSRATVTLTVTATPVAPAARDDAGVTVQDRAVTIDVLANDGLGTAPTSIAVATGPAAGDVECTTAGCTYTPRTGFVGTDEFRYTITDGDGAASTATVVVEVLAAPTTPAPPATPGAVDDAVATTAGTPVVIDMTGNDRSGTGVQSVAVTRQPSRGTVLCTVTSCTYTPDPGTSGVDSFEYAVTDANGATSVATVTVTVASLPETSPTVVTPPVTSPATTPATTPTATTPPPVATPPTVTPPSVVPPTVVPTVTAPPTAAPTSPTVVTPPTSRATGDAVPAPTRGRASLPRTGGDLDATAAASLVLLLAGGLLVVAGRRRRREA